MTSACENDTFKGEEKKNCNKKEKNATHAPIHVYNLDLFKEEEKTNIMTI